MNLLRRPLSRRAVIKGLGLGGLAGWLARPDFAPAAPAPLPPAPPGLVLVSGAAAQAAFARGLAVAWPDAVPPLRDTRRGDVLPPLRQALQSPRPMRVLGLVDDASAAVIIELARSAGARLQWLGQHASTAAGARHQVLALHAAGSLVAAWSEALQGGAQPFLLSASPLYGRGAARLERGPIVDAPGRASPAGDWAASLGFVLAAASAPSAVAPRAPAPPLAGHYVSFSFLTAGA